jgi:hypothetical protein
LNRFAYQNSACLQGRIPVQSPFAAVKRTTKAEARFFISPGIFIGAIESQVQFYLFLNSSDAQISCKFEFVFPCFLNAFAFEDDFRMVFGIKKISTP